MARISIILPVYNAEATLARCLESLKAQTVGDFEVIAVDDGSSDGSPRILSEWASRLPMRVVTQSNAGASAARNAALGLADGEFVYMLDADDFIHPRTLELAVAAADASAADFVLFDHEDVEAADADAVNARMAHAEVGANPEPMPVPPLRHYEEKIGIPVIWHFLYRRSSLAGMRFPEGIMYEDNVFVYEYLARKLKGVHLASKLYFYVQEPKSVMHATNAARKLRSMDVVMRELARRLSVEDWAWLFRKRYLMSVKTMWRDGVELPLLRELTRGWFRDGVMRRADFPWRWRLRFRWYLR